MHVDRPRADRAAAGQRNAGMAEPGEQRRQNQHRRAHFAYRVIRRFLRHGGTGVDGRGMGRPRHVGAVKPDHAEHVFDVGHIWQIGQFERVGAEQGGRDLRQGSVLGAGYGDRAFQSSSADDPQSVHG